MAKTSKTQVGYQEKPTLPVCANCQNYASEMRLAAWMIENGKDWCGEDYTVEKHGTEKNIHCALHGFSIKKLASCSNYAALRYAV